ncbi:MAG: HAMP domain-containing histidine kinase [Alphaproteobacteria bacterium]|nr:HAMP domain-containing histidine kinase [Alphaproteobacteria bacterium]
MWRFTTSRAIAALGLFALAVMIGAVAATDLWLRQLSEERMLAVARRDASTFRTLYARLPEPARTDALLLAAPAFALQAQAARGDIGQGAAAAADPCGAADRDRTIMAAWFDAPVANSGGFVGASPGSVVLDWERLRRLPSGSTVRFQVAPDAACNRTEAHAVGVVERIGDVHLVVGGLVDPENAVRSRVWMAGAGAAGLIAVAGVLAFVLVTRRTADQVRDLSRVLTRAGRGDFAARADVPHAEGEFAILGGQINDAIDRLATQNRGLREIASRIAHDFQRPLTAAQFKLEDMVRAAPTPEARASAEAASGALDELSRGFRAYLDVGEIAGGMIREFSPIDLSAAVARATEFYADGPAEQRGIQLELSLIPSTVLGSTALIERAISNLLSNAVKFSPDGGHVRIDLVRAGAGVVLEIRDQGPGWPAELEDTLGQFGVRSERDEGGGHGVGLASVIAIMAHHGGSLERSTTTGGGAVARLVWPVTVAP